MKYIKETLAFAPILGLTRSRLTHREDSAMGTQTRLFKVHPFLPELKNDQRGGRFSRGGSSPQQHMDSEEPELIQRWAGALVLPAFQTFSVPCSQFATTKITKTLSLSASWIWTPPHLLCCSGPACSWNNGSMHHVSRDCVFLSQPCIGPRIWASTWNRRHSRNVCWRVKAVWIFFRIPDPFAASLDHEKVSLYPSVHSSKSSATVIFQWTVKKNKTRNQRERELAYRAPGSANPLVQLEQLPKCPSQEKELLWP